MSPFSLGALMRMAEEYQRCVVHLVGNTALIDSLSGQKPIV